MENASNISGFTAFMLGLILIIIIGAFYFLPTLSAWGKCHRQVGAIFVCNLLLGWTFIGWVVSLIWACTESNPPEVIITDKNDNYSSADELLKLAELKEKGIITQEEFEEKKKQILSM